MTGVESRYFLRINGHPRQRYGSVETLRIESHDTCKLSRFIGQCKASLLDGFMVRTPVAIALSVASKSREPGYSRYCHLEERWVVLKTNALVANGDGSRNRGSAAHKRIEHNSPAERQRGAYDLSHEGLRL